MSGRFDFSNWAAGVLENTAREHEFGEKLEAYCATLRMIDETLGEALAAGDDELVAEIKKERDRFERDHIESLVTQAKELNI